MDGAQRPVVAGVHRLKHVQCLGSADLADDDAVGTHAKRVANELADCDLALAFDVLGPRLESEDVPLVEPQLGRVLDRDDAILVRDRRRHRVQQGRLTGTRAARDEDVQLCSDALLEEVDGFAAERAEPDQVVKAPALVPELADRHERA